MKNKIFLSLLLAVALISALLAFPQANNSFSKFSDHLFGSYFSGYDQPPKNFQITAVSTTCVGALPQVTISWSDSSGAVTYKVQRKYPASSANWETVGQTTGHSLTDTTWILGYQPGSYPYRIQALSSPRKNSGKSTTVTNTKNVSVAACQTQTSSASSTNTSQTGSGTTTSPKKLWGAYTGDTPASAAAFESLVGKAMNMQAIFVSNTDSFPSEYGPTVRDQGKTLVIFWEPSGTTLDNIISGTDDSRIKQFASGAKTYGGPVIFVPFHEMNGNWDSWDGTVGSNTAAKEISAWRHVHDLFGGITNVKFGWAVNNESVPDTATNSIAAYYPGSEYVDYVGVDGFNFGSPWQTFSNVFDSALSQLKTYNKPIYIFSTASTQGSQKAAWITDFYAQLQQHPEIVGWIWFNQNKEENWLVNSDANSLSAFKLGLQ